MVQSQSSEAIDYTELSRGILERCNKLYTRAGRLRIERVAAVSRFLEKHGYNETSALRLRVISSPKISLTDCPRYKIAHHLDSYFHNREHYGTFYHIVEEANT